MGATKYERINPLVSEFLQIVGYHPFCYLALKHTFLHERNKERARLLKYFHTTSLQKPSVCTTGYGCPCPYYPYPSVSRGAEGSPYPWLYNPKHRNWKSFSQNIKGIGACSVAGNHKQVYTLRKEKLSTLKAVSYHSLRGFVAIGHSCCVSEIHKIHLGVYISQSFQDCKPANSRIKDANFHPSFILLVYYNILREFK